MELIKYDYTTGNFKDKLVVNLLSAEDIKVNLFDTLNSSIDLKRTKSIEEWFSSKDTFVFNYKIKLNNKIENYIFWIDNYIIDYDSDIITLEIGEFLSTSDEWGINVLNKPIITSNGYYLDVANYGNISKTNTIESALSFIVDLLNKQLSDYGGKNNLHFDYEVVYNITKSSLWKNWLGKQQNLNYDLNNIRLVNSNLRCGILAHFINQFCKKYLINLRISLNNDNKILFEFKPIELLDIKLFGNSNNIKIKKITKKINLNNLSTNKNLTYYLDTNNNTGIYDGVTRKTLNEVKNISLHSNFKYNYIKQSSNDTDLDHLVQQEHQKLKQTSDNIVIEIEISNKIKSKYYPTLKAGDAVEIIVNKESYLLAITEMNLQKRITTITLGNDNYGLLRTNDYQNELIKE